jgi:predicted metal-dependent phosphoesterase TrpH
MNFDLHCHSRASDGLLTPTELVARAHANGVTTLALTDHDGVGGVVEAREQAERCGLQFVDGVEISVSWNEATIHVVGLKVDPRSPALLSGLASVRARRGKRAEKMAQSLEAAGIPGSLQGAMAYVEDSETISRTHFARFLVQQGHARDVRSVFHRFLVKGKPGYVPHDWASLGEAVGWIRASGGIAVVAHPGRYSLSRADLRTFFAEFREAGGAGIEVITGSHTPDQYREFARLARELGFLASRGSDFHGPGESKIELGSLPPLPHDLKPVWHDW